MTTKITAVVTLSNSQNAILFDLLTTTIEAKGNKLRKSSGKQALFLKLEIELLIEILAQLPNEDGVLFLPSNAVKIEFDETQQPIRQQQQAVNDKWFADEPKLPNVESYLAQNPSANPADVVKLADVPIAYDVPLTAIETEDMGTVYIPTEELEASESDDETALAEEIEAIYGKPQTPAKGKAKAK